MGNFALLALGRRPPKVLGRVAILGERTCVNNFFVFQSILIKLGENICLTALYFSANFHSMFC